MKEKLIIFALFSMLFACTSPVSGNDINHRQDGSINALYSTIKNDKGLYMVVETNSENEISNQVYSSLLTTLMALDGLTHLYKIDWAKDTSNPDDYLSPLTIDALCVGNIFLEKYHKFGSKKYALVGGYEDMYKLSMSYQPLYRKILEQNLALSKQAGMESMVSFDCLELMNKEN
mgnify:CR=1 FL=1